MKYTLFQTDFGLFALAEYKNKLIKTQGPCKNHQTLKKSIKKSLPNPKFDENLLKNLQKDIKAYFKGNCINFEYPINLDFWNLSPFTKAILHQCRKTKPGQTITYAELAQKAHHPNAARAAGSALAKNPMPIIIPCHRVIKASANPGNFSHPQGRKMKIKLLQLEKTALKLQKSNSNSIRI